MANQGASTSRRNDLETETDLEYQELNKKQRLKAALYYGIKQISKEVEQETDVKVNSQVLATLCESLHRQTEIYAIDLELFAKHGKRTNISVDDVKLLARRNRQLLDHLDSIVALHVSDKEATKKQRKTNVKEKPRSKKGTKSGASSKAAPIDIEVDED